MRERLCFWLERTHLSRCSDCLDAQGLAPKLVSLSPAERRDDIWPANLSPLAASVEADEGATSLATVAGTPGDTRLNFDSTTSIRIGVPRQFGVTLRDVVRVLAVAASRQQSCTPAAPSFTMVHVDVTRNRGSHDGLYAARLHWHDHRRLLRRLRQSSGFSAVRSCRIRRFGGITGSGRRGSPNGSRQGVGSCSETEQRRHAGLHAARVYWRDSRLLLRCLW